MSDSSPTPPDSDEQDGSRERPDWLWKVIWIIMALVLLQVGIVLWFWLKL